MAEKKKIYRAGVIPYIIENNKPSMMFMMPSNPRYGGEVYQIAKGKIEDGEETESGALREAKEELGLFTGNIDGDIVLVGEFMGRTTIYLAKIKDKDMFGDPTDETGSVRWMTVEEFSEVGRDLHKPVVKAAYRKIIKIENLE